MLFCLLSKVRTSVVIEEGLESVQRPRIQVEVKAEEQSEARLNFLDLGFCAAWFVNYVFH